MTSLTQAVVAAVLLVWAIAPRATVSAQEKDVAPPTEPWAAQTGWSEITLVWGAAPGATEYRLSSKDFRRSAGQARRYVVPFKGTEEVQYYVQALDSKGRTSEPVAFNAVLPITKDALPERPTPPHSVSAAETSPGEITVTWTPVDGATAYFIGRSVFPQGHHTLCSLCSTATKYVDQDLKAGAEHAYTVAAITPAGTSQRTRSNPLTPSGEKGRPPIDFRAVLSSAQSITLQWKPVTGAERYTINRSINDGAFRPVATVGKTEYVYGISRGKPTVFRFELIPHVKGSALEGARSNTIVVDSVGNPDLPPSEVVADVPPKGTVGLRAVRSSFTSITLTWPAVTGATQYVLKHSRDEGAFVPFATLSKTEYLYPVKPDTKRTRVYRFELISQNAKGDVAPPAQSDPITVDSTPFTPPAGVADGPPKGAADFQAVRSSPSLITLTWSPVAGATQYTIRRSRDAGEFAPIATVTKTEYLYRVSPVKTTEVLQFELLAEGPKGAAPDPARSEPITVEPLAENIPAARSPEPRIPPRGVPNDPVLEE